ncbi:MAG TPA: ferritin-like domain-containing protein [Chthoniobacteraceae bacterium]|nr:ferritin-like domain-containing protein [Chthoniobacteraceae bacterium]
MNYQHWIAHFRSNKCGRPEPDWAAPFTMPEKKRRLLAKSIAEYQLGDGGGECRLVARDAEIFRGATDAARIAVDLWFEEEREHSRLLACAVRRIGAEFISDTFAFRMFYAVRRALGVQFELFVLLVVEIVSTGYYRMIRRHAGDEPLAAMCKLILRDEARHIDFHRDRLAAQHPRGFGFWRAAQFRLLGCACASFLWLGHGRALRALGGTRAELAHHVRSGLANFLSELAQLTATTKERTSNSASAEGRDQPAVTASAVTPPP